MPSPKIKSPARSVYVPGTYTKYPAAMLSYRDQFKQVGKQVYVLGIENKNVLTLAEFSKKYPNVTLRDYMSQKLPNKRLANEAELAQYQAARERVKKFTEETKAKELARRIKSNQLTLKWLANTRKLVERRLAKLGAVPLY